MKAQVIDFARALRHRYGIPEPEDLDPRVTMDLQVGKKPRTYSMDVDTAIAIIDHLAEEIARIEVARMFRERDAMGICTKGKCQQPQEANHLCRRHLREKDRSHARRRRR